MPQAWVSPYQCLHILPPFEQDVASVAPFSRRLASLSLLPSCNNKSPSLAISKLGYLQQRCTPWSLRAPRLANLRWGGRKAATSYMAFVCHTLACQHLHATRLWRVQFMSLSIVPSCRQGFNDSRNQGFICLILNYTEYYLFSSEM